jgi:hypothetical protein
MSRSIRFSLLVREWVQIYMLASSSDICREPRGTFRPLSGGFDRVPGLICCDGRPPPGLTPSDNGTLAGWIFVLAFIHHLDLRHILLQLLRWHNLIKFMVVCPFNSYNVDGYIWRTWIVLDDRMLCQRSMSRAQIADFLYVPPSSREINPFVVHPGYWFWQCMNHHLHWHTPSLSYALKIVWVWDHCCNVPQWRLVGWLPGRQYPQKNHHRHRSGPCSSNFFESYMSILRRISYR